jgi:hypothetical protein
MEQITMEEKTYSIESEFTKAQLVQLYVFAANLSNLGNLYDEILNSFSDQEEERADKICRHFTTYVAVNGLFDHTKFSEDCSECVDPPKTKVLIGDKLFYKDEVEKLVNNYLTGEKF